MDGVTVRCACGQELSADFRHCTKCGKALAKTCGCGLPLDADFEYCPRCGKPVSEQSSDTGQTLPSHHQEPLRRQAVGGGSSEGKSHSIVGLAAGLVSLFLPIMVLDLFIGVVGLVFSGIGMAREQQARGIALAGLVVSIVAVVGALSLLIMDPGFYDRIMH